MAQSEEWARRLLRELKNPRELLLRRRYRTPVFLRFFLDRVEELCFRDPRAGLNLARFAPQLALLIPKIGGRREHRESLVRAHSVLAGAYRATGRHTAAEAEYERAARVVDSEALSPVARADLNNRRAVLQVRKGRFSEALDLVDAAAATYRTAKDRRRLAEAHGMRGFVLNQARRFAEAIPWHGEALNLALSLKRTAGDPAEVAALARVVESARANMAHAVMQSPNPAIAGRALDYIPAAHRELRGQRNSLTRHLLQWTEGRFYMKLCLHRRAEVQFKVARRGFVRLEAPWEIAFVSLDLAVIHRLCNEWEPLEALAENTCGLFCEFCGDFEAIAALSLWVEAVENRKGAAAAIDAARKVLEARQPGHL